MSTDNGIVVTKIITLWCDADCENPAEQDGAWSVYSFNRRHASFKHPDHFRNRRCDWNDEIKEKLAAGLAFFLDYFEHGACCWSLASEGPPSDRWDTARFAGLLVWEHDASAMVAVTPEDRAKYARSFLETYTKWCNGECYGFTVADKVLMPCGHHEVRDGEPPCGGYLDVETMAQDCRELVEGSKVTIEGDARYLADYHDFGQWRK